MASVFLSHRVNHAPIIHSLSTHFVTAILGARRVGKSTFIQGYTKTHPNHQWVYFNMDVLSQRKSIAAEHFRADIEKQALQKIGAGEKLWVVIDEAQKCPELFDQIKLLYEPQFPVFIVLNLRLCRKLCVKIRKKCSS